MNKLLNIYRFIFCRPIFYRFNYHVYRIALRGVGVLNSEGNDVTGERYFQQLLHKKKIEIDTVFDVGANAGGYVMDIMRAFPSTKIHAFEPHPNTFHLLKKNIKSKNVILNNVGIGEKNGTMTLWDFADDATLKHTQPTSTLASVHKEVITKLHGQKAQGFKARMTTVDRYCQEKGIEGIDILKMDTEGNELDVLKGARKMIKERKIKIVQFEFNEMNAFSRSFLKDFYDELPHYSFYRLMPYGLYSLGKYRPSTWEVFAFQNIVAVRKDIVSLLS